LIRLRKVLTPLARLSKERCEVTGLDDDRVLLLRRWSDDEEVVSGFNFNHGEVSIALPIAPGRWRKALDSTDLRWHGRGSLLPTTFNTDGHLALTLQPKSLAVFERISNAAPP
jgi:maltooligosyltrehalose trehalohydrolase